MWMSTTAPLLAAADGRWATLGPQIVVGVLALLVFVWIGVFFLEWRRRRQPQTVIRQSSLFDQLCQAHGLDIETQERLIRIANGYAHDDIVLPFVDPRILESAVQKSPELIPLGRKLFGTAWRDPAAPDSTSTR